MRKQRVMHFVAQWIAGLVSFLLIWSLTLLLLAIFRGAQINQELLMQDFSSFDAYIESYNARIGRIGSGRTEYVISALAAVLPAFVIYRLGRMWSYHSRLHWLIISGITVLVQVGATALLRESSSGGFLIILPTTLSTILYHLVSHPVRLCDRCRTTFIPKTSRYWEERLHPKLAYRWKGTDLCPDCVTHVLEENKALQQRAST
jgi:hypothetical protein